jgi:hypothetical protein
VLQSESDIVLSAVAMGAAVRRKWSTAYYFSIHFDISMRLNAFEIC